MKDQRPPETLDDWRRTLAPVTRTDYRLMFFELGVKMRQDGDPRPQAQLTRKWGVRDEMMQLGWDVCEGVILGVRKTVYVAARD